MEYIVEDDLMCKYHTGSYLRMFVPCVIYKML